MADDNPTNYVNSLGGYSVGDKVVLNTYQIMEISKMFVEDGQNKFFGFQAGDRKRVLPARLAYLSKKVSDIVRKVTNQEWELASAGVLGTQDHHAGKPVDDMYAMKLDTDPVKKMYMDAYTNGENPFNIQLGGKRRRKTRKNKKHLKKSKKNRKH